MRIVTLALACATSLVASAHAAQPIYPDVAQDERLVFPRDHGAHPDFRTEWWYVTGWLKTSDGEELGFQVTFFRSRLAVDDANPSRFAPKQLLFAHAALADAKTGHLLRDERIARAGFGIAETSTSDASVALDRWRFQRVASPALDKPTDDPSSEALHFKTSIDGARFALDLDLQAHGPLLAEGADPSHPGYSQKGPSPRDASRYYSVPQLAVSGSIARGDAAHRKRVTVHGTAWLDREWSSAYLDPQASGWDWVGLNFDDGSALMAFRMRDRAGNKLWAGGTRRLVDGRIERYAPDDVTFTTRRTWKSSSSGTTWPVSQKIVIAPSATSRVSPLTIVLDPMMDDQELDSRASTGAIYWEGAVRIRNEDAGPKIGRGYLELTGYARPIEF